MTRWQRPGRTICSNEDGCPMYCQLTPVPSSKRTISTATRGAQQRAFPQLRSKPLGLRWRLLASRNLTIKRRRPSLAGVPSARQTPDARQLSSDAETRRQGIRNLQQFRVKANSSIGQGPDSRLSRRAGVRHAPCTDLDPTRTHPSPIRTDPNPTRTDPDPTCTNLNPACTDPRQCARTNPQPPTTNHQPPIRAAPAAPPPPGASRCRR